MQYRKVNSLFERALILLNKMPLLWKMYLRFLLQQPLVTATRKAFDRSLRALPVAQHGRIWTLYKSFANSVAGAPSIKIWQRYMQVRPDDAEDFVQILSASMNYSEAARKYVDILNNPR